MNPQKMMRYWVELVMGIFMRKLREVPGKITNLAASLRDTSEGTETNFLETGQKLQTIYMDTTGLTRHVRETTQQLTGTGDENMLSKIAALVDNARNELDRHQAHATTSLAPIKAVINHLANLYRACDQIDRIALNLRVVGLNIGIESTRSEESLDMFTVVSEEIIDLSDKVIVTSESIREEARTAGDEQENALEKISGGLCQLQSLSSDASKAVNEAVDEIENCMQTATEVFDQAGNRFDDISRQVGEIVTGIQFHDSMRQRIEHISDALMEMNQQITKKPSGGGSSHSITARWGEAHAVAALQTLQLGDVIEGIGQVYRQSATAFEGIGNEMEDLSQSIDGVCRETTGDGSFKNTETRDPFERLIGVLDHLKHLIGQANQLAEQIEENVLKAAEIGRRFSRYVKEVEAISFETHIKALNTIVKSARLGHQGQTLEVLAQEMNLLSKETDEFVAYVEENLQQVGTSAEKLKHQAGGTSDPSDTDHQRRDHAVDKLTIEIDELAEIKNQIKEQLGAAAQRSEAITTDIEAVLNGLDFLPRLSDDMTCHLEYLEGVIRPLQPFGEKFQKSPESDSGKLAAVYTMQRERDIHGKLFSDQDNSQHETEALPVGAPSNMSTEDQTWDASTIELFDNVGEETEEDEHRDLGDNVELF